MATRREFRLTQSITFCPGLQWGITTIRSHRFHVDRSCNRTVEYSLIETAKFAQRFFLSVGVFHSLPEGKVSWISKYLNHEKSYSRSVKYSNPDLSNIGAREDSHAPKLFRLPCLTCLLPATPNAFSVLGELVASNSFIFRMVFMPQQYRHLTRATFSNVSHLAQGVWAVILVSIMLLDFLASGHSGPYERTSYFQCNSYINLTSKNEEDCAIWCKQQEVDCPNQCIGFMQSDAVCHPCLVCPQLPYETNMIEGTGYLQRIDVLLPEGMYFTTLI